MLFRDLSFVRFIVSPSKNLIIIFRLFLTKKDSTTNEPTPKKDVNRFSLKEDRQSVYPSVLAVSSQLFWPPSPTRLLGFNLREGYDRHATRLIVDYSVDGETKTHSTHHVFIHN